MAKAQAQLRITGLARPGLVRSVEDLLSAVEGVEYAHVNLGAEKVTINYDDTVTGVEALLTAMNKAGFYTTQD